MQLETKKNLLNFAVKRSKVKVMTRLNMVKHTCSKIDLSGEGIPVDGLLLRTI